MWRMFGDDQLRVTAAEADLDNCVGQLVGHLGGGDTERLEQHHAQRRLYGIGQPIRRVPDISGRGIGRGGQVVAEAVDVRREVHDVMVTSQWRHVNIVWRRG